MAAVSILRYLVNVAAALLCSELNWPGKSLESQIFVHRSVRGIARSAKYERNFYSNLRKLPLWTDKPGSLFREKRTCMALGNNFCKTAIVKLQSSTPINFIFSACTCVKQGWVQKTKPVKYCVLDAFGWCFLKYTGSC